MSLVEFDAASFDLAKPARIHHNLSDHPLLTVPELTRLCERLPSDLIRYHSGRLQPGTDFDHAHLDHATGLSLRETMDHIETAGSFVQINHVELDRAYGELVRACLEGIRDSLRVPKNGFSDRYGWIFVSSPRSVTPFHIDHNQNFLLQVRGKKRVHVWDPADRTVLPERALESFHAEGWLKEINYRDEFRPRSLKCDLVAGDGVYMPFTSPHMVENGPEVSITLSVTFTTSAARRSSLVYIANQRMRRLGFHPVPFGQSPARDSLKQMGMTFYRTGRRVLGSMGLSRGSTQGAQSRYG